MEPAYPVPKTVAAVLEKHGFQYDSAETTIECAGYGQHRQIGCGPADEVYCFAVLDDSDIEVSIESEVFGSISAMAVGGFTFDGSRHLLFALSREDVGDALLASQLDLMLTLVWELARIAHSEPDRVDPALRPF